MSSNPSPVYEQLLAACPPARLPEAWQFVAPHPDARMLEETPPCLIARLRQDYSEQELLDAGVLLRQQDRLRLHPHLVTDDHYVTTVRNPFGRVCSLLTSKGGLGRLPPLFCVAEDESIRGGLRDTDECLYATGSMADYVLLRSLGLPAAPAKGLERLSRRGLEHLLCLVGGWADPPISPRRLQTGEIDVNLSGRVGNPGSGEFSLVLLGYDLASGRPVVPAQVRAVARHLAAAEKSLGICWDGLYVWWPTDEELQSLDYRRRLKDAALVREFFRDPESLFPVSEFGRPDALPAREKPFAAVFDELVAAIRDCHYGRLQLSDERLQQRLTEYHRWVDDMTFAPLVNFAIDCGDPRVRALRMQQAHLTRILQRLMPEVCAAMTDDTGMVKGGVRPDSMFQAIEPYLDALIRLVKADTSVRDKKSIKSRPWWPR